MSDNPASIGAFGRDQRVADIVIRLRAMGYAPYLEHQVMQEAADEIEMLRAERDELRREVCCAETPGETQGSALLYAKSRGWDCFDVTKCQPPAAQTDEASQEDGA